MQETCPSWSVTSVAHKRLQSYILTFFFVVVGYNVRNQTGNEKNGKARSVLSLILLLQCITQTNNGSIEKSVIFLIYVSLINTAEILNHPVYRCRSYHAYSFQCEKDDAKEDREVSEVAHGVSGRDVRYIGKDVIQGDAKTDESKKVGQRGEWR